MDIIVCIKQVPDAKDVRLDPETNTLAREGVEAIMNPFDRHALEEAVSLKEQLGGKVTVLSMGPPRPKPFYVRLSRAVLMPVCLYQTVPLPVLIPGQLPTP